MIKIFKAQNPCNLNAFSLLIFETVSRDYDERFLHMQPRFGNTIFICSHALYNNLSRNNMYLSVFSLRSPLAADVGAYRSVRTMFERARDYNYNRRSNPWF